MVSACDKFKGLNVHVIDNEVMPTFDDAGTNKAPMIIGDLKTLVMFERKGVEVKVTDVGVDAFETGTILMKATEREQVRFYTDITDLTRDIVYGQVIIKL